MRIREGARSSVRVHHKNLKNKMSKKFKLLTLAAVLPALAFAVLSFKPVLADPPEAVEAPVITSVSPNHGTVGTSVLVSGLNLSGDLTVAFSESPYDVAIYQVSGTGNFASFVIPVDLVPLFGRGQNLPLSEGHHSMWIINEAGSSNVVQFTIDAE